MGLPALCVVIECSTIQFFFLFSIVFLVVLPWKIILLCPKEHYNNSHWLMIRELLKGDLTNSHSFWADAHSNRSRDANNTTGEIHHLEAHPLLLASVPDNSLGTGEWEEIFLLIPTIFNCFVETNLPVTAKVYTSLQSHHASHNDPRISFIANRNYKFWSSAWEEHLEAQSPWHQVVHKWLPLLQWSHKFTKDQQFLFQQSDKQKKMG